MPTRFIHSRSRRMPSLVTLPFIQCHHTRGRAAAGGSAKSRRKLSSAHAEQISEQAQATNSRRFIGRSSFNSIALIAEAGRDAQCAYFTGVAVKSPSTPIGCTSTLPENLSADSSLAVYTIVRSSPLYVVLYCSVTCLSSTLPVMAREASGAS